MEVTTIRGVGWTLSLAAIGEFLVATDNHVASKAGHE